jgi:hypothetical protein
VPKKEDELPEGKHSVIDLDKQKIDSDGDDSGWETD